MVLSCTESADAVSSPVFWPLLASAESLAGAAVAAAVAGNLLGCAGGGKRRVAALVAGEKRDRRVAEILAGDLLEHDIGDR